MAGWSRGDKLALAGIILAIIGILLVFPKIKVWMGIDKPDVIVCLHNIKAQEPSPSPAPQLGPGGQFDAVITYHLLNKGSAGTTVTRIHFDVSGTTPDGSSARGSFDINTPQDVDANKLASLNTPTLSHVLSGNITTFQEIKTHVIWIDGQGQTVTNITNGSFTNDRSCPSEGVFA